jgi:hypothetical protein
VPAVCPTFGSLPQKIIEESGNHHTEPISEFTYIFILENSPMNDSVLEQVRQFGDAIHTDQGLAQLAQAQTDEEALAIEASLLVETNFSEDTEEKFVG